MGSSLRFQSLVLLLLIAAATTSVTLDSRAAHAETVCRPFSDVTAANPACENISWLKASGITKPTDDLYHPTSAVTRGAMTAFLFRMTHPGQASPLCAPGAFPDVTADDIFCGYIGWAAAAGIAKGYPDGTFRASASVTRGAMAAFLHRISDAHRTKSCDFKPFRDVRVTDEFCGVIAWAAQNSVTVGTGAGNYGIRLPVTRQAMASFLHRVESIISGPARSHQPTCMPYVEYAEVVEYASTVRFAEVVEGATRIDRLVGESPFGHPGRDRPITHVTCANFVDYAEVVISADRVMATTFARTR